ncbi:flagellar hook-length control protein FliK [Roseobacter denitrificans]|nr:flagellar hook-length control protein FliK [Roseobacter denitrificans]
MGKTAQNKKIENADSKEQAFDEEYAATGDDVEGTEQQQTDESQAADQQSADEAETKSSDDTSPDTAPEPNAQNSDVTVEEQPAFAIAQGSKAAKTPEAESKTSPTDLSSAKRANMQESAPTMPADAAQPAQKPGVTKTAVSATSAAEAFVTAKAAENAALSASPGMAGNAEKSAVVDPQPPRTSVLKQANTATALVSAPISGEQPSEKLKSLKLSDELAARAVSLRSDSQAQPAPPMVSSPAQTAKLMPLTALSKIDIGKEKMALDSTSALSIEALSAAETRSASSTSTTPLNQLLARAETPTAIARQMAEALQKLPDRPVEISLNPKELGRVRMNISAAEAGITVTIVTERPETLDLMRRNIDQLVREFQAIGYNDINFAFSEGETQQGFAETSDERNGAAATQLELLQAEETAESNDTTLNAQTGVDIRL